MPINVTIPITAPSSAPIGDYTLWAVMEDLLGEAIDRDDVEVTVY